MTSLEPLKIPLQGLALIEASAGTGKTYTITTLYVRLLLERGLEVDQILVVTFTEAATEELRDRIRKRLAQALDWLQGDIEARRDKDPTLADLLLTLADREAARTALTDALTRMDEAAIHTIHGFCLRTLQDNAFESGAAFDVEFITDETRLRETAVEDFWRSEVARATSDKAEWVRGRWTTPEVLLADLRPTLALDDLRLLPEVDELVVTDARRELGEVYAQLRELWRGRAEEVKDILTTGRALKKQSYNKNVVAKAISAAEELVSAAAPPQALPAGFDRLTPAGLERGTKADHTPPVHPFFDLCERYEALLNRVDARAEALFLTSARRFVREALDRRKREEGLLYFDDLLRRLDRALDADGGAALAARVRERYPVALIDEFQDTDAQQYRIFRYVYGGQKDCGLFLIGDPKQAIYAFRGADIFTYMRARDDSENAGKQYTLGINWRSGSRLVKAVNTLFGTAHEPFVYEPYIGFDPVAPSPRADEEPLHIDGREPVPLQLWMLKIDDENQTTRPPGYIRGDAALDAAAQACAEHIAGLLNLADDGRATIGGEALAPSDVVLLVRTHREGDLVQRALRACGISSVSLSQDSVFATEDADELATLLEALVDLRDEGKVRAALATTLIGRNASELERLACNEAAWEELLARFQSYAERWRRQGTMVALQELLAAEQVPARLLRRPDGERRLTNLLQLLELLQLASGEHPGIDGLLRWLADQRAGGERDEARQLRLESDEGLVKVVTLHKSKGLEYPLVYIPFPWSYFKLPKRPPPAFFHAPEDKMACLDLGSDEETGHRELERTEQLAERLRLFYVGVTRAARLCVLCWGKVNQIQDAALAYLLHRDPERDTPASRMQRLSEEDIRADLDTLAGRAPDAIEVRDLPSVTRERWAGPSLDAGQLQGELFDSAIDAGWRVASYSGLVRGGDAERPDYDGSVEPRRTEAMPDGPVESVFELPAGTHAGHFLHQVFEEIDFPRAGGEVLTDVVRGLLERYGGLLSGSAGAGDVSKNWAPVVEDLVTNVLDTYLDPGGTLRLRDVAAGDRIAELEFHFPVVGMDPDALRAVLAISVDHAGSADSLGFEPMRGLMRGFIDLVFRRNGRFYVVDYKSNRLGNRLPDYGRDGLREAIKHHRYDLQYLIYTLALHRFLGWRLPAYDYERHFGGVYYLFLRGMRPDLGPKYGVWYDRPQHGLIRGLDRLFAGEREAV
jgi:exodeoxyribonuclease V beta subunit